MNSDFISLASYTAPADIADFTRAMTIKFVPVSDYAYRGACTPDQLGEARRFIWVQRGAVLERLTNMLAGLLPEGVTVKRGERLLEIEAADRPGRVQYDDRVSVELDVHDKGIGLGEYLAFTVRRGGYAYRPDKTVRKVLVKMSAGNHTVSTDKLDATLGELRDLVVEKVKLGADMATYRHERALESASNYQKTLAGLPDALRAQLTSRYGGQYIDGTDIKLHGDGKLTLEDHRLVIKPELLSEFVDLLRRNNAK